MDSNDDQTILLKKTSEILLGTYDFKDLAHKAVDLIVKQLRGQGLAAAGVFRAHPNENLLRAYAYSSKYSKVVDKILPTRFSELSISLSDAKNLAVKTVVTDQV